MNDVMISITVPAYNHEQYIVRALDSILMQKTQYSYEVLVGEDCSTDGTRKRIQEWERQHPGVFSIFYREKNLNKTDRPNAIDLLLRTRGKYVITLEGDDYWTDPNKLEKQASFLEAHPEYYAVAHNCIVVDETSEPNGEKYPECKDAEYTLRHFASDILPGQYTTVMSRNYWRDEAFDKSLILRRAGPGDRRIAFSILCQGRIYCIQETMSAYRHITKGGSSYSANHRYQYDREEPYFRALMEYACHMGHKDAMKFAQMLYLRNIRFAKRKGHVDNARAAKDRKRIPHKLTAALLLLKRDVNYRLLHKTLHV